MLEVRIKSILNTNRKYKNYEGRRFSVFKTIDNFGDYCIALDRGQPFMFINSKDCEVIF